MLFLSIFSRKQVFDKVHLKMLKDRHISFHFRLFSFKIIFDQNCIVLL